MKIKFDIECTPEEARTFLGMPDVRPMQERMMQTLEEKLNENISNLDPETLMKTWLPLTVQGWGEMQKMFWNQMHSATETASQSKSEEKVEGSE